MRKIIVLWALFAWWMPPVFSQTHRHDPQTIQHWQNLRIMPSLIIEVSGDEVSTQIWDQHITVVRTYFVNPDTVYARQQKNIITEVDRKYLAEHKKGLWLITYCHECRLIFQALTAE